MANTAADLMATLPTLTKFSSEKSRAIPLDIPDEEFIARMDAATDPLPPEEYAFIRQGENVLRVSGENGHDVIDYYGEFRGGYPYIDPALEKWAEDNGGFWEWEDASNIGFYKL